jgi:alpha-beta hydrolase superfamily lysophospholipase
VIPLPRTASSEAIRVDNAGLAIHGFLHRPSRDPDIPCVVLCHGLMSSMESPKFRILAEALCHAGMAAVRFDFRGCGASEGDIRETTLSGRATDLEAVLQHVRGALGYQGPLGLLGSSMGGFVSLLTAARSREVRALCVWATPFDLGGLVDLRGHPDLAPLGPAFYQDLKVHDLVPLAPFLHHLLVLHGEKDEVIPQSHARRIFEMASPPKKIRIFPGGDHRFTDPVHRTEALELSVRWFQKHLLETP